MMSPEILSPIPALALPGAAELWWRAFGVGKCRQPAVYSAAHGIVALSGDGTVVGVAGLRDARGGFLRANPLLAGLAFRPAPPTADLVIDGIIAAEPRQGIGRALIAAAAARAETDGHPGLRAEVALRNLAARAFYQRMGFVEVGRGRYGWPWSGQVVVLRRAGSPG